MDLFELGIKADTRALKRGQKDLDNFARTGERTEKRVDGSMGKMRRGMVSVRSEAMRLQTVLGLVAGGAALRGIANATLEFQRIERSLAFATGSAEEGARAFGFVSQEAERLGLNVRASAGEFAKLAAAAKGTSLEGKEAERIFTGVASASSALGLSVEQTRGALNAIQQMISKGNVQAEELRGQLGERLPGAFQLAAKAMGVTTVELNKMLEMGEVAATDLLPKLATALQRDFGDAAEEAADSAFGAFNRLSNSFDTLKLSIGESGLIDALAGASNFLSQTFIPAIRLLGEEVGVLDTNFKSLSTLEANVRLMAAQDNIEGLTASIEKLQGASGRGSGARVSQLAMLNEQLAEEVAEQEKLQARIDALNTPVPEGGLEGGIGEKPNKIAEANRMLEWQIDLIKQGKTVEQAALEIKLRSQGANDVQIAQYTALNSQLATYADAQKQAAAAEDERIRFNERLQAELEQNASDFTISLGLELEEGAIKTLAKEFDQLDKLGSAFDGIGDQGEEAIGRIIDATKAFKAASLDSTDDAFGAYAQGTASALMAVQSFVEKGSDEYKKIGVAVQALQTAQAIAAVINQGTSGDPYTAFGRMAAMAAAVASLGVSVGSISGGGGGFDLQAVQAAQGTGSVLGDATAQSESIANAIESMERNSEIEVGTSAQMLRQLQMLNQNISGLGTILARQFGDFSLEGPDFSGFDGRNGLTKLNDATFGAIKDFTISGFANDLVEDFLGVDLLGSFGDVLGGIKEALFGSSKKSVVDSGIGLEAQRLGDALADGLEAFQFNVIETVKKRPLRSPKRSYDTQEDELSREINRQLELIISGLHDSVLSAAEAAFGIDASGALSGLELERVQISLRGLSGDERTEALEAAFGKIGDQMAGVVPRLDEFQVAGEGLFETLSRVGSDVARAEYQLEQFGLTAGDVFSVVGESNVALELMRDALAFNADAAGVLIENFAGSEDELIAFAGRIFDIQNSFINLGLGLDGLTDIMVRAARGSEALQSGIQAFTESFRSESDQFGFLARDLAEAIADAGHNIPATREGFRDLIEGLDRTTESGQAAFGSLIVLSDQLDELYSYWEGLNEQRLSIERGYNEIIINSQLDAHNKQLRDLEMRYERERQVADEAGASIVLLEKAYGIERNAIMQSMYDQARAEAQRAADFNQSIQRQLGAVGLEGKKLDIFNLGNQRADALKSAADAGGDLSLVNLLFDRKSLQIELRYQEEAKERARAADEKRAAEFEAMQRDLASEQKDLFSFQIDALGEQIDAAEELLGISKSLRDFARDITLNETNRATSFDTLNREFFVLANQARGGDSEAAGRLTDVGRSLIDSGRSNLSTRLEFDTLVNTIAGASNAVADQFDFQTEVDLLTTQVDLLTDIRDSIGDAPLPSVPDVIHALPQPVNNQDDSRIAELEAQVKQNQQDTLAALQSIAKHTAKTAKHLNRWDGDGMPQERDVA